MTNILETIKTQNHIRALKQYTNDLLLSDETINFILKCYKLVTENLKIVNSQYEFSKIFLASNKYYYGKLKCEMKSPSLLCIATLIKNLKALQGSSFNNDAIKEIDNLYLEGKNIIYKKLLL